MGPADLEEFTALEIAKQFLIAWRDGDYPNGLGERRAELAQRLASVEMAEPEHRAAWDRIVARANEALDEAVRGMVRTVG